MKKYKLCRKDFAVRKNDILLFPTIRIHINDMFYWKENFSVEFHFAIFHARLLFLKEEVTE